MEKARVAAFSQEGPISKGAEQYDLDATLVSNSVTLGIFS